MTDLEDDISRKAARWVSHKENKQQLIKNFVSLKRYPVSDKPVIVFMAGSPGAGKTEFVNELKELDKKKLLGKIPYAIIDPDAIRPFLPGYKGNNSYLFQNAVSIGVDKLYRSVIKNRQNAIVDGTFANYKKAHENVQKALESGAQVIVLYIFQHPAVAWDFTCKREIVEGRNIRKKDFIDKFIAAKDSVEKIKEMFGKEVQLNIVIKDYKDTQYNKRIAQVFVDTSSIAETIAFTYTKEVIGKYTL